MPTGTQDKTERKGSGATPSERQFFDEEGNPLPPEIQRQLREQFNKTRAAASASDDAGLVAASSSTSRQDVEVTGRRPRGSVVASISPDRSLDALEVNAYGASTIGDLIQELGPQVRSNRGQSDRGPITLLNGRRVASFNEIAQIPSEAIERLEVFPEELGLKYGYRADQKVVNIVTFEQYRSRSAEIAHAVAVDGGYRSDNVDAGLFAISGDKRFDISARYHKSPSLSEEDGNIVQPFALPGAGKFRTLLPGAEQFTLSGLIGGNPLPNVGTTVSGRYNVNTSKSLLGLGPSGALKRDTNARTVHTGTTMYGTIGAWLWTFTGNYDRVLSKTNTDTGEPVGGRDQARFVNTVVDSDFVVSGSPLKLPAGPMSATIRGGVAHRAANSMSRQGGVSLQSKDSRDQAAVQINLDIPISRSARSGALLGAVSANLNLTVDHLSDFDTLRTLSSGINWSPKQAIRITASYTGQQRAPTIEQLGAPLVATPNVRTFDVSRRELVDATLIYGGNPDLRVDDQRIIQFAFSAQPLASRDLTFSFDYSLTRINHPIADFPIATPAIEAAFPGRFTRDADGALVRIDSSPVNFYRSNQKQIKWGFSFVRPLGPVPPWMRNVRTQVFSSESAMRTSLPPGAKIIIAPEGGTFDRALENSASRFYVSIYHTWHLRDEVVARRGLPALDLLDGAMLDARGGRPQHELDLRGGVFSRGLGARMTAKWQSGFTSRSSQGGPDNLRFSDFATVDINVFANLGDRVRTGGASKWFKGVRATFGINNLFNTRQEVRDGAQTIPLNYQSAYLDPIGRYINIGLRKVF